VGLLRGSAAVWGRGGDHRVENLVAQRGLPVHAARPARVPRLRLRVENSFVRPPQGPGPHPAGLGGVRGVGKRRRRGRPRDGETTREPRWQNNAARRRGRVAWAGGGAAREFGSASVVSWASAGCEQGERRGWWRFGRGESVDGDPLQQAQLESMAQRGPSGEPAVRVLGAGGHRGAPPACSRGSRRHRPCRCCVRRRRPLEVL